MNKRFTLLLPVLVLALASLACGMTPIRGSGDINRTTWDVSGFDRISVANGMTLYLVQGDVESLEIETYDNILPYLEVTVGSGELIVRLDQTQNRAYSLSNPIKVYATLVDIRGISLSGGSRGEADGIDTDRLELNVSGGGRINLANIATQELSANLSGGSHADLQGAARVLTLNQSGGGETQAGELQAEMATVEISGGGQATVWSSEQLDSNLSGGSQLRYYGRPLQVVSHTSGGARLTPLGEK